MSSLEQQHLILIPEPVRDVSDGDHSTWLTVELPSCHQEHPMQCAEDQPLPSPKSCRCQTSVDLWTSVQGQVPVPVCLSASDNTVGDLGHFPRNPKTQFMVLSLKVVIWQAWSREKFII